MISILIDNEISTTYHTRINGVVYFGYDFKDDNTRRLDIDGASMYGSLLDDYKPKHQEIWREFWSRVDEFNFNK